MHSRWRESRVSVMSSEGEEAGELLSATRPSSTPESENNTKSDQMRIGISRWMTCSTKYNCCQNTSSSIFINFQWRNYELYDIIEIFANQAFFPSDNDDGHKIHHRLFVESINFKIEVLYSSGQ